MRKNSVLNDKLVVQPVFISLQHKHVFMGPCRYGIGEELTYDYDHEMAQKDLEYFEKDMNDYLNPAEVELLDTKFIEWHEDFAVPEDQLNAAIAENEKVDAYLISGTRLISYVSTIIGKRTNKPLDFGELNRMFRIMRVRKALKNTKIMYALRNNVLSFGCVSSFINLQDVTDRFGTEIVNYNGREFFNMMDEFTEEDNEQAKKYAEELVREANAVHMPAENIVNDCKFYLAVNKVLDQYDCNAFTIPCFEMCATRELNKRHLTFCLTNSLLKDDGIPAACAADVGSVISLDIMMNIARKSPHMGNCMVMVKDIENNTMRILHDVATRCMKGYDNPDKVDYVSFTKGNWGATMRYDFAKDAGETITMINISPKMDKIMIAKGEITGCDDFLTQECKHAVVFKVKDARDFHAKQEYFGQHYVWVYGDYTEDLKAFAKLMGMEAVLA